MNQLTTIASLPGTGGGCASALKGEKPMEKAREKLTIIMASVPPNGCVSYTRMEEYLPADLLDTSEGGQ